MLSSMYIKYPKLLNDNAQLLTQLRTEKTYSYLLNIGHIEFTCESDYRILPSYIEIYNIQLILALPV